jgi:molybdenum cofactor cytidylyltransferase
MVRTVASNALAAGLSPVIVVTGAFHEGVSQAVADLPVTVIQNPEWETGQSSSVRAGLVGLPAETGSALFLLVDQPQVPVELMRSLVALHAETLIPIVAPRVDQRRANPVLFDRLTFPDLMGIQGDVGGRVLFSRYPVSWLDWEDENLLLDIDTEEDYHGLGNAPLH